MTENNYLLFAGTTNPEGGIGDLVTVGDDLSQLILQGETKIGEGFDWWHVYSVEGEKLVAIRSADGVELDPSDTKGK